MKTIEEVKQFIRLEIDNTNKARKSGGFRNPQKGYKEEDVTAESLVRADYIISYLEWLLKQMDDNSEYMSHINSHVN